MKTLTISFVDQKNKYTTGIVLAFILGVGLTFVLLQSAFVKSLSGNILDENSSSSQQDISTGCTVHEDCAAGLVCKLTECVPPEKSFCSQPFMLAESVEGRFVRYTECKNGCVATGDTARCQ